MLLALIVGAEIAFWILLLAGLVARYLLRWTRLSTAILLCIPLVELALLAAAAVDLNRGGDASRTHGLVAVFLGATVAFGPLTVQWVDVRFAHRFAGGPAPVKPPKRGPEHARRLRIGWYRHLLAWAVGNGLLLLGIVWVGDADRTEVLWLTVRGWTVVLAIDFAISFSYTLWPRRARAS